MKYVPAYDGLRAISVLAVVLFHLHPTIFKGGWIGVDTFFVLSGFLITSILARELKNTGKIDFKTFYFNRVIRLAPALIFVVVVVGLLTLGFGSLGKENYRSIALTLAYMSNWNLAYQWWDGAALSHTSSLSVEEQFYFIWPLLFIAVRQKNIARLAAAIITFAIFWQVYLVIAGASSTRVAFALDTRCVSIMIGCFLAVAANEKLSQRLARYWLLPCIGLIALTFLYPESLAGSQPFFTISTALMSAWLLTEIPYTPRLTNFLSYRALVYIGKISYGIYLWHAVLIYFLHKEMPTNNTALRIAQDVIVLVGGTLLAALSFKYIEKPLLRFKSKPHLRESTEEARQRLPAEIVPSAQQHADLTAVRAVAAKGNAQLAE